MKGPHVPLVFSAITLLLLAAPVALAAQTRAWTTRAATVHAEYISSTKETVTLRRADGQALRLKLTDLSDADREFVAQKQAAEKEANMIDAVLKGEIIWRLPNWSSLGWSNTHPAEIFLWDEQTRRQGEKVAAVKVNYVNNQRNRNQIEGSFKTEKPVRIAKNARVIIKANFDASVNGKARNLEEFSAPMPLPALNKGEIKLPAMRLTITR